MVKFYKCQLACVDISCRGKLGEAIGEFIVGQNYNDNVYYEAQTGHMFRAFDYDAKLTDSTGFSYPNIFVCQGSLQEISCEEASKELEKEEYGSKEKVDMKLCRAAILNGLVPRREVLWANIVHTKPSYSDSLDLKDLDDFGRFIVIYVGHGCYAEILTGQKFGYLYNICRNTGEVYPIWTKKCEAYLYTGNPLMVVDKERSNYIKGENLRDELKGYVADLDEKKLDENFKKTQEILDRAATDGEFMQDYTGLPLNYGFKGSLTKRPKSNKE